MILSRIATTNVFQGNAHIQQSDKLTLFSTQGPLHHNMLFNTLLKMQNV